MKYSVEEDKELLEVLMRIRKKNWDKEAFRENLSKLIQLVNKIKKRHKKPLRHKIK
jgi:uracil phosphoribosyltransferase